MGENIIPKKRKFNEIKGSQEREIFKKLSSLKDSRDGIWVMKMTFDGSKAFQSKNFEEAVDIFKKLVEIRPDIEINWYMLLESLSYLGQWEEIISVGEQARQKGINFAHNYIWIGQAHDELGKHEIAKQFYHNLIDDLLKTSKDSPDSLNTIGGAYIRLGDYEKGLKYSKKALKFEPQSEHHLHNVGWAYMEMKEYEKAIKYYEQSLKFNPEHSYAWFDLGLIYEDLGDMEKAIHCFEKAVECSPQWIKLREKLMTVSPNSTVLDKKILESKKEMEHKSKIGNKLYADLHEKKREYLENKSDSKLEWILERNAEDWVQFLESEIRRCEMNIKRFQDRPILDPIAERLNDKYPNSLQIWRERKKFNEKHLELLKSDPNYVQELRKIMKETHQNQKDREQQKMISRKINLENQLKMEPEELIQFLKHDIQKKEEVLDRLKLINPLSPLVYNLDKLLTMEKDDLSNLEKNSSYIHIIKTQIQYTLDNLENFDNSTRNRMIKTRFRQFETEKKQSLAEINLTEEEKDTKRHESLERYLFFLNQQLDFLKRHIDNAPNDYSKRRAIEIKHKIEHQIRVHNLLINTYEILQKIVKLQKETKILGERKMKGVYVDDLIEQNRFALEEAHYKDREYSQMFKEELAAEKRRLEEKNKLEEKEAEKWLRDHPDIGRTLPDRKK